MILQINGDSPQQRSMRSMSNKELTENWVPYGTITSAGEWFFAYLYNVTNGGTGPTFSHTLMMNEMDTKIDDVRWIHWIGLRENLQETMVFTIKYRAFL